MARAGSSGNVVLIHWNRGEAEEKLALFTAAGFRAEVLLPDGLAFLKTLTAEPPVAIVISLDRLPSQGRDVALAIRMNKGTRAIPLIFAGGALEKVARARESLPDAIYVDWTAIGPALQQAVTTVAQPVVPTSVLAAYAGSPLAQKLGLKTTSVIALLDAPEDFADRLLSLIPTLRIEEKPTRNCNPLFWFVRHAADFDRDVYVIVQYLGKGSLWIFWPKGTSSGLSPLRLRTAAMALAQLSQLGMFEAGMPFIF
ncbi:MAG: hypothetical protein ABJF23_05140, partial [Bryobacteraceae bacterium]